MRMACGQVRTLLASNTGKVVRQMGEGPRRTATGDARGVADDEARSRKATEGICGEVINARRELVYHSLQFQKLSQLSICAHDATRSIAIRDNLRNQKKLS